MKITFHIALICLLFCISCKNETNSTVQMSTQIEKATWLLGRWENNTPEGNLSETWQKTNDSTFFGESHFVINNDTVFAETIQLENRSGNLFYIVTVPGQHEEKPVAFELTGSSDTQLVFENPAHDFPNRIVYEKIGNDSLIATIFGNKDGKENHETFKMKSAVK